MFQSIIILLLALVPAFGWMAVYRYLDSRDPEPLRAVVFALLMGVLSTIPVFILQYIFSTYPEFNFIAMIQDRMSNPVAFSAVFLTFVAVIEELAKIIAFIVVIKKFESCFNQIVDGILYGAMVGIGFAIAENAYYFIRAIEAFQLSSHFLAVFSIRSFGTMLAHTLFTGIFGFYFAKAYFSPFIDTSKSDEHILKRMRGHVSKALRLHMTFFHLLPGVKDIEQDRSFSRAAVIIEGFLVASLVHFFYNAMIKLEVFGRSWTFLIIPLIFMVAWLLWSHFFLRMYNRIIDIAVVARGRLKVRIH